MVYDNLARALHLAAEQMRERLPLSDTLEGIVRQATEALPSFDHVGLSTTRQGGPVIMRAASSPLVCDLDHLQYTLGEGPCADAITGDALVVSAPHVRHDQRWPRYVPRAVDQGLCSQLAVRLFVDNQGTVGVLSLYSTTTEEISPEDVAVADLFAAHATVAFGQAWHVDQLAQAVESRQSIGMAVGLIMERFGVDEAAAKAFLWRASSTSNTKVREVAEQIVRSANAQA